MNAALLLTGAVGVASFMVLISASADVYEAVTNANGVSGLDRPALDLAISLRTPAGERWVTAFTNLGGTVSMVFITLTLTAAMYVRYLAWWLSEQMWVRVICPSLGATWAVAMGLSRVYLGHHWITDVMCGLVFGLAWLALLITVHRIMLRIDRRDQRIAEHGGIPDQPPEKAIEPDGGPASDGGSGPPSE